MQREREINAIVDEKENYNALLKDYKWLSSILPKNNTRIVLMKYEEDSHNGNYEFYSLSSFLW